MNAVNQAADGVIHWLRDQQAPMESLLRQLVEASSWTLDKPGVDAASSILRAHSPLVCEPIASASFGDHSVFHNAGGAARNGVMLVGHIDTVFPKDKFSGYRVDGGIARGPGVLDMKGGLVVIAFALRALAECGLLARIPLTWVVVGDEEVGSPDSAPAVREMARGARAALVFESGRDGDRIITRRKGTGAVTAVAHGRAAHAGNAHHEGANAIWALARFVEGVQSLTDYTRGRTVNVGKISGGMGKNTVPDRAEAQVDLRYVTRADGDALREAVTRAANEIGIPNTSVTIEWGAMRTPLEATSASQALLAEYARCQREVGLGGDEMPLVGGGSDASTTADAGVPSIDGLGPRGRGFHTLEEFVELGSLIPKSEALVRFLAASVAKD